MSSRCLFCHSIVTADEKQCYMCGASMPLATRAAVRRRPVFGLIDSAFLAFLGITGYYFFAEHLLSLPITIAIASTLALTRILAGMIVNRRAD